LVNIFFQQEYGESLFFEHLTVEKQVGDFDEVRQSCFIF